MRSAVIATEVQFAAVIPARYASERLPGKMLRSLNGIPLLQHVWNRARESAANEVVIATDDQRVERAAESFGAGVCMTSAHHQSGTDRIAEVADALGWPDDRIVVNLQGDEPLMPPQLLEECAALLNDSQADLATLASPLEDREDFRDHNVVKVVVDDHGFALYFSRAPIPHPRDPNDESTAARVALHHHGIYAYRCGVLRRIVAAPPSELERCERLEQLRALGMGLHIKVGTPSARPSPGVDTLQDLERTERALADRSVSS